MGQGLAAVLGAQRHLAGRQAAHFQQPGIGQDGAGRGLAQEIDGQAGGDGARLAGGADDRGIHGHVGQAHQHGAGHDAAQALVAGAGGQAQQGGARPDRLDLDAQHLREGVLLGQQLAEFRHADPRARGRYVHQDCSKTWQ